MNSLEKKRTEVEKRYKEGTALQQYRNLDYPYNPLQICEINLNTLFSYFNNEMNKEGYEICADNVLIVYVSNYLSSVKGYLERKRKTIQKKANVKSKNDILGIISKYWKKNRCTTALDRVVQIRDRFDHEKIDGIKLSVTFHGGQITRTLMIDNCNMLDLFNDAFTELEKMNGEINSFVRDKIAECDLWDCLMFKQSFGKKYGPSFKMVLNPPPGMDEMKKYDDLIDYLEKN